VLPVIYLIVESLFILSVAYLLLNAGSYDGEILHAGYVLGFITARCTLVQSAVLRSHVVCLSVCLSVCNVGEL